MRMISATVVLTLTLPLLAHEAGAAPGASGIGVDVAARSLQPGELVVLTMTTAAEATGVKVRMFGQDVSAFDLGGGVWRALVGIDVDRKPGAYDAAIDVHTASQTLHKTERLTVLPRKFPTRTLRVAPDFVNPPPTVLERIEHEAAIVRDAFAHATAERLWSTPFVRPVPDAANSRFGTRSIFNGEPRSRHSGTDFLSAEGTPVKAPNAGRVLVARELFYTGNTVMIDHGLGVVSMLAHLSRIDVQEGEIVSAGQVAGLVGATGRVTGPHLHWALRVAGARVDPLSALELLGEPAVKGVAPR